MLKKSISSALGLLGAAAAGALLVLAVLPSSAVHSHSNRPDSIRAGAPATAPAAFAQSAVTQGQDRYRPLQSISYELGSKITSGYFVQHSGKCLVSLMVIEKSLPEQALPFTAARVRLILNTGQIAGLDSEEGRSLNFTCGPNASALFVDAGERDRLVALQRISLPPVQAAKLP
jgi:hypothetical protein